MKGRTGLNTILALTALSRSFRRAGSFYVLGAGVSAPHVPTINQLSGRLLRDFLDGGIFQTEPLKRDTVSNRVIRDPECWKDPMRWELIQRLPPGYVTGKLPTLLSAGLAPRANANYRVFNLAAKPSTIFNMNVDGLASRICKGHRVFEAHGRSPGVRILKSSGWTSYVDAIREFPNLPPPLVPGLVLPGPEPAAVLARQSYKNAEKLLKAAQYISIVGYSFGGMDDIHTHAFLTSRISPLRQTVIVISLDPLEVTYRLADTLKSSSIFGISANWAYLANAIAYPRECRKSHPVPEGLFCAECVNYQYEVLLNANG